MAFSITSDHLTPPFLMQTLQPESPSHITQDSLPLNDPTSSIQIFHAYHHHGDNHQEIVWETSTSHSFDQLVLSWTAQRPEKGYYIVKISVLSGKEWSPWIRYAKWENSSQITYSDKEASFIAQTDQDECLLKDGYLGNGFRVKIEAHEGALLENWKATHVCTSSQQDRQKQLPFYQPPEHTISLPVQHLSQMSIAHEKNGHMCSATATTAVIRFLKNDATISPLNIALGAHDDACDVYGNWIFCTAQANHILGDDWEVFVGRLSQFDQVIDSLHQGIPVVMSVRGPLEGSALSYTSGHLLTVVGYDPIQKHVICMDPAFESGHELTHYNLDDFLKASQRRGYVSYFFKRSQKTF